MKNKKERGTKDIKFSNQPPKSGIKKLSVMQICGLLLILIIAFIIRLYPVINNPEMQRNGLGAFGDTFGYHVMAFNLCKGHGYSSTATPQAFGDGAYMGEVNYRPGIFRPPAYPLFLCAVYKLFGVSNSFLNIDAWKVMWDRVRIIQSLLDSLCCVLIFFSVRTIYPRSFWLPLISAALYSFCFYNIYYTRALLSETIATFLLSFFVLLAIRAIKCDTLPNFFFAGAALGLTLLAKKEYLLFVPVFTLFIISLRYLGRTSTLKKGILFMVGAAIIVAPWTIRNYVVFKTIIPLSEGGAGEALYFGESFTNNNYPYWWMQEYRDDMFLDKEEKDKYIQIVEKYGLITDDCSLTDVKEKDKAFMDLAKTRMKKDPIGCLKNWFSKIFRLWYINGIHLYRDPEPGPLLIVIYFIFAFYGILMSNKDGRILMAPIYLLFIYLTILLIPIHVESRYSAPQIPGIITLAGIGMGRFLLRKTDFET